MRSDEWLSGFRWGVFAGTLYMAIAWLVTGCTSAFVPRGGPIPDRPCVGTYQADSAWVCAPRDTTGAR